MNDDDWHKVSAAMDAALREAGRVRGLAEARERRGRHKLMATPEWQAAHAARCAQWQVHTARGRVVMLRTDIAERSVFLRRLVDAIRNARSERRGMAPVLLERFTDEWRIRRRSQRELRTAIANLSQLEAAPEPNAEAVAVVEPRKLNNG